MALLPAAVVIMPGARMLRMEVFVRAPELTMKGAMLCAAVEPAVVGTFVAIVKISVLLAMLRMIPCVAVVVGITFMSRGRRDRCEQSQRCDSH
jgi:hypothetical protein